MKRFSYLLILLLIISSLVNAEDKGTALVKHFLMHNTVIVVKDVDSKTNKLKSYIILKQGGLLNDALKEARTISTKRHQIILGYSGIGKTEKFITNNMMIVEEGDGKLSLDDFIKLWEKLVK